MVYIFALVLHIISIELRSMKMMKGQNERTFVE